MQRNSSNFILVSQKKKGKQSKQRVKDKIDQSVNKIIARLSKFYKKTTEE